jgi:PD-(D/E)XK nuclease superfamily
MADPSVSRTLKDLPSFVFSASSLQDYADCPRRFKLRYLDQLVWPAVEAEPASELERHQREALLFHRMVQQYLMGMPAEKVASAARSPDLARWWRNYIAAALDFTSCNLQTERTLSAGVGSYRLIAKFDLLAIQPGRATVYDWKTYAKRPRQEWLAARWQTRVYRAMVAKAGAEFNAGKLFEPRNIAMIFWFAEFPNEPAIFDYDPAQFKRDWSAIESLIHQISEDTAFPMTDDFSRCRFCVYRSLCDRGEKAGALQDADGDAAAPQEFDLDFEQIGEIQF